MRKDIIWVVVAGLVVGTVAVVLVGLGNPGNMGLCMACFERDIAGALGLHKPWAASWLRPEILGVVLGAFITALVAREWKPKGGSSPFTRFVLAMFVMIGALAFLGCPTRMALRLGAGDLNALVALLGFTAGIVAGVQLLKRGFTFGRASAQRAADGLVLPVILAVLVVCAFALPSFKEGGALHVGTTGYIGAGADPAMSMGIGVIVSLAAGLLIGFLGQRSRLCFVGGIRDIVLIRSPHLLIGFVAVVVAVMVGSLITGRFQLGFEGQPIAHTAHMWNFLGMGLVGLASVMLGGCPFRQLVLAGNGNTDSAVTVFGMLAGAAVVHNCGLAKAASTYGKIAVVVGIVVSIAIGLSKREK